MATIDENNKVSRKSIFNIEEMDLIPYRRSFTKISGNQISLFAKMYHAFRKPDVAVGVISFR
jgi:alkyl hydroperoxide reductase subunit AhpC